MPAELHVYGHENGNERPLASLVRPITDARLSDEPRQRPPGPWRSRRAMLGGRGSWHVAAWMELANGY